MPRCVRWRLVSWLDAFAEITGIASIAADRAATRLVSTYLKERA